MMNEPAMKKDMLRILDQHRGAEQAIQVRDLTLALGLYGTKTNDRLVRAMKRDLVEDGHLIASSCGKNPGYFLPMTAKEMEEPLANYKARIRSLAKLVASIEGAASLRGLWGQLELELENTCKKSVD